METDLDLEPDSPIQGKRAPVEGQPASVPIVIPAVCVYSPVPIKDCCHSVLTEVPPTASVVIGHLVGVHSRQYLRFLVDAYSDWNHVDPSFGDSDQRLRASTIFPPGALEHPVLWRNISRYTLDPDVGLGPCTGKEQLAAAWAVMRATDHLCLDQAQALTWCVGQPGSHAGTSRFGGPPQKPCFLNFGAIAACRLSEQGIWTAVLSLDRYRAQGTEEILSWRRDVMAASVHLSPVYAYPYYRSELRTQQAVNVEFGLQSTRSDISESLREAVGAVREWLQRARGARTALVVCLGTGLLPPPDSRPFDQSALFVSDQDYEQFGREVASAGADQYLLLGDALTERQWPPCYQQFTEGLAGALASGRSRAAK